MIINWSLLWIGTIMLGISYMRMRDRISIEKRSKIEITIMSLVVIFLLIDIYFQILERKETTENINDCIRYYRYYGYDLRDVDFNFIQNCYDILGSEKIDYLKKSGVLWQQQPANQGFIYSQNKSWEVN